jgi:hypothetical protein
MFSLSEIMLHCRVDRYPGSECVDSGGGDQHYEPLHRHV